jgi:hypothetical protein
MAFDNAAAEPQFLLAQHIDSATYKKSTLYYRVQLNGGVGLI